MATSTLPLFLTILAIRLVNSLSLATFFQPDEFFQSLEVFLRWTTWEWKEGLRSIAYPWLFYQTYKIADFLGGILALSPAAQAELTYVSPKIVGAFTAATGDLYTFKFANKIWGEQVGIDALVLSLGSAFHWFCFTRTFTNSLETTITIVALYYWDWRDHSRNPSAKWNDSEVQIWNLRKSLALAALAFTIRPTNMLIWFALGVILLLQTPTTGQKLVIIGNAIVVGTTVLLINSFFDSLYYGKLVFPPYRFIKFNVLQSLSHFYGTSPWHYYLSQGLPILLIGYLPITLIALYSAAQNSWTTVPKQIFSMVLFVIPVFSCIAHKEVRFIYPLLPALHVLVAGVIRPKRWMMIAMIAINIPVAFYASYIHQRGAIDVVNWLRREEHSPTIPIFFGPGERVGFLMPCHSTPWSSHMQSALVKERIDGSVTYGWALTCEPPIGIDTEQRRDYLDEADVFYANQTQFLIDQFPAVPLKQEGHFESNKRISYQWPDKLVIFEQALEEVGKYVRVGDGGRYFECKRFFNSQFHDDWRRTGDLVVLCLGS